jgi:16S rRNA processing protein RimM
VILKFKEFSDINEVEGYKKCELYVDREHAIPLEEGEYYVADLIGLNVISDDGVFEGTLTDVLQTGANDVYVIEEKNTGRELLLPVIPDCVLDVSLENKLVKIHILKGLL